MFLGSMLKQFIQCYNIEAMLMAVQRDYRTGLRIIDEKQEVIK